jgi:hypothetical protein
LIDLAGRRQDAADLREARRADFAWMAAGAGILAAGAALLTALG